MKHVLLFILLACVCGCTAYRPVPRKPMPGGVRYTHRKPSPASFKHRRIPL